MPLSVSKRPFPTSQSTGVMSPNGSMECIKEAVPDQPEPDRHRRAQGCGVYQRGRSRPARANRPQDRAGVESVSKRPFPTSQSSRGVLYIATTECIKEAVPDQPEPGHVSCRRPRRVYQRGRSRPARATKRTPVGAGWSVSKRPFPTSQSGRYDILQRRWECIKEAVPDQPELGRTDVVSPDRVYQRGRSRPARATSPAARSATSSVSKRPFPTSQSDETTWAELGSECIKEAVPDQPEPVPRRLLRSP